MIARVKKAFSLVDYTIIITVVVSALTGMSLYLQRGIQARVADMSDSFIVERGEHLESSHLADRRLSSEGGRSGIFTTQRVDQDVLHFESQSVFSRTDDMSQEIFTEEGSDQQLKQYTARTNFATDEPSEIIYRHPIDQPTEPLSQAIDYMFEVSDLYEIIFGDNLFNQIFD